MSNQFDLVLRGGTVVDGTGGAPFEAAVAISAGLSAEVGLVSGYGTVNFDRGLCSSAVILARGAV